MVSSSNSWDFLTLLPESNNVDMYKDVGMIPYTLSRDFGLHTAVASSNMDENAASQLDMENTRMDIIKLKKCNRFIAGLLFLLKNAGRIKVLNLYHGGKVVVVWAAVYKLLNPGGKVYLKLDMDFRYCEKLDKDRKYRKTFRKALELVDNVSVESAQIRSRICKYTDKSIDIIYNGYFDAGLQAFNAGQKEDIFLTVGRLGTEQKATEVLLEAFAKSASEHNWKLVLVGKLEEEFKTYLNRFEEDHMELSERINFVGALYNKQELFKLYDKAKVFVLPSRWESFGIVAVEALSRGCSLILSEEVAPCDEFTCNGIYGDIIPADDEEALSSAMVRMARRQFNDNISLETAKYAEDVFNWKVICNDLYLKLNYLTRGV